MAYPFILRFVREFTHGTCLTGSEHEDTLGFCKADDARAWVESINAQNAKSFAKHRASGREITAYMPGAMTYKVKFFTVVEVGA